MREPSDFNEFFDPSYFDIRPKIASKEYLQIRQDLDNAREWFEEIVNLFYSNTPLNTERLEFCLEELASYLGVKIKIPENFTEEGKYETIRLPRLA